MRIKICGLTRLEQAQAIVAAGATDLGFICVSRSPRYIDPFAIANITPFLPPAVNCVGVFVDVPISKICDVVETAHLSAVQLHGDESPTDCQQLKAFLPGIELIKAVRLPVGRDPQPLIEIYRPDVVDTLLIDAYHPQQHGGTGLTLDWKTLQSFNPPQPWFLAGGLRIENLSAALEVLSPAGIDLSSGVERAPGDKDLHKVAELFQVLKQLGKVNGDYGN
ncbi:MAG: phosphoribosylanthranilate isomerase [Cyanobacteria bacterium P01_H01_bin.15]